MIVSLRLGLREFGWDFDTMAPPHDHYCKDSGFKWTSFSQDDIGHTEMFWLQLSIVEGSGDVSSISFFTVYGNAIHPSKNTLQGLCPSKRVGHRDAHFCLEFADYLKSLILLSEMSL